MSERRKKDLYNETWTKDDLTKSLKKSSHRSEKSSRSKHGYEEDYARKDRKRRDDGDETHHKSRSDRTQESKNEYDIDDHGRNHRSKREEKDYDKTDRDRKHRSKRVDNDYDLDDHDRKHRSRREDKDYDKADGKHRSKHYEEEYADTNRDRRRRSKREGKEYVDDDRDRKHRSKRDVHERNEKDYYKTNGEDKERHRRDKEDRKRRERSGKSHGYRDEEQRNGDDAKHRKHRDKRRDYSDDEKHRRHEDDRQRVKRTEHDSKEHRKRDDAEYEMRRDKKDRDYKSRDKGDDEERRIRKEKRRKDRNAEYEQQKSRKDENEGDHRRDKHRKSEHHSSKYEESSSMRHQDAKTSKSENLNSTYIVDDDVAKNKDDDYNYDDEDFEDYDDDFEDEDEEVEKEPSGNTDKMDELMRAIAAENERANSAQSSGRFRSTVTSDRNDSPFSASSSYDESNRIGSGSSNQKSESTMMINFSAAKKSSANTKVRNRIMKRSKDLMNLIQLDSVAFNILDLAPVTEYNLYIKNYGNSNMKQASVQCNEDNLDQEIQTEIFDSEEKWSQHPPHAIKCCGGVGGNDISGELHDDDRVRMISTMRGDSKRLTNFLSRACKLMESVLIEDEMWEMSSVKNSNKSNLSFCEGYVSLRTNLAYLQGRVAVHVDCCSGSSHNFVAVAFNPAANNFSLRIDRKGLVAVWDSRKPTIPEKILVCDASPTHCSFSSTKTYLLFVGTDDGSVLLYDLRESGVHHQIVSLEPTRETILRSPTYTTGYLTDGHSSPVVSIMSVGVESKYSENIQPVTKDSNRNHSGLAFQLASLEEAANLCIWIVVELLSDTSTDDDIGLAPHGRMKLIRSLSLKINPPLKSLVPDLLFRTTCVKFSVVDPNNFYVGTDTGHIVHCTQYMANSGSRKENTKNRLIFFNDIDAISSVNSIDINPFQLFGASMILAGYDDGSLRLFLSDRELPVISWPFSTEGSAVIKVQWSTSRPSVFFVLDSSQKLHIWDLAIMHAGPIKTEQSQNKRMRYFSLSNTNVELASARNPEIVLAFDQSNGGGSSSSVEIHALAPHFSQLTDNNELEQLTFILQSLL